MKLKPLYPLILIFAGLLMLIAQVPATAAPLPQTAVASPTPLPDGRIIYFVQAGDTCTSIADRFGVTETYLRTTNVLDENCSLREGQQLLLGIGGPASASPTPNAAAVTPTVEPTPTISEGGSAILCVLMYDDVNGDALRQETEFGVANGAISVTSSDGLYSQTQSTVSAIDPDTEDAARTCFENMQPGDYTISAAIPDGYNATTGLSFSLAIIPGDTIYLDFGAQSQAAAEAQNPTKKPSPLLGILGALFLLGGIGLGVYTWRILRKK